MEGVIFVEAYDADKPEAKRFAEAYKKEYNEEPYGVQAFGWDGIHLLAQAIEKAGSLDKEKIRQALAATKDFQGATGAQGAKLTFDGKRTGFDPNGAVVRVIKNNQHGPVVYAGQK
jgi:branched-chain amino acid transport system substrate-binding protein